jgi:hypothetical protein
MASKQSERAAAEKTAAAERKQHLEAATDDEYQAEYRRRATARLERVRTALAREGLALQPGLIVTPDGRIAQGLQVVESDPSA